MKPFCLFDNVEVDHPWENEIYSFLELKEKKAFIAENWCCDPCVDLDKFKKLQKFEDISDKSWKDTLLYLSEMYYKEHHKKRWIPIGKKINIPNKKLVHVTSVTNLLLNLLLYDKDKNYKERVEKIKNELDIASKIYITKAELNEVANNHLLEKKSTKERIKFIKSLFPVPQWNPDMFIWASFYENLETINRESWQEVLGLGHHQEGTWLIAFIYNKGDLYQPTCIESNNSEYHHPSPCIDNETGYSVNLNMFKNSRLIPEIVHKNFPVWQEQWWDQKVWSVPKNYKIDYNSLKNIRAMHRNLLKKNFGKLCCNYSF